jgi:hypothetical protein
MNNVGSPEDEAMSTREYLIEVFFEEFKYRLHGLSPAPGLPKEQVYMTIHY